MHTTPVSFGGGEGSPGTSSLLATVEVAAQLGIERSTLSRWVKEGRISPAMRLPGKTGSMLFDPADVTRLAEELGR